MLTGHKPYPAIAIDRHWTLVSANRATEPLLTDLSSELLRPPVNVLRLSLHPDELAIESFFPPTPKPPASCVAPPKRVDVHRSLGSQTETYARAR